MPLSNFELSGLFLSLMRDNSLPLCLKARVYTKKIQVTSGIFNGYTSRKCCITILYHAIENTVASKASIISAKYAQT